MSYSLVVPTTPQKDLLDAVETTVEGYLSEVLAGSDVPHKREAAEHLHRATDAIEALLPVIGRPDDPIRVTISGHANVDHAPSEQWANEMINITLSVTDVPRPG